MPASLDLEVPRNGDYYQEWQLCDAAGAAIDLTSSVITMACRRIAGAGGIVAAAEIAIVDPTNGQFTVRWKGEDFFEIEGVTEIVRLAYDMRRVAGGITEIPVRGHIVLMPEVTVPTLAISNGSPATAEILASENIPHGSFVNVFNNGGATAIRLADASDPDKFASGFAPYTINSGSSGYVAFGGINTSVSVAQGVAQVWLSDTVPGGFATVPPSTPGHIVQALGSAIPGAGIAFYPQGWVLL
jgi:hypothetical protein